MEHLSGVDDFWLRMEKPENPLTITALLHFEGALSLEALKSKFGDDLLRFRRFRQLVTGQHQLLGQPRWEDDRDFSLGNHVFHRQLPAGDEEGLRALIGELMSEQLPEDKPLWDAHLIDGPRAGSSLLVRVHHSLADGFSLIRLMFALIDADCPVRLPGGATIPSLGPGGHALEERPDRVKAAREFAERLVNGGLRMLRHPIPETEPLKDVATCAARLFALGPDPESCLKGPLSRRKAAAWSRPIPIDGVKQAARRFDGTINDLLLGALAGAIRRYLLDRDDPIAGEDLRAIVPVNVRPFEKRTTSLGNGFGLVFLELPVGVEKAEDRLARLKERMDALKHSPEAFVTFGLMQAVGMLPAVLQQQLVQLFFGKATAIVTNMPGPVDRIRLAGATIDDAVFFVPQSAGAGIGVSIFSYAGAVRIGVAADAGLVPDPSDLVNAYHAELEDLGVKL